MRLLEQSLSDNPPSWWVFYFQAELFQIAKPDITSNWLNRRDLMRTIHPNLVKAYRQAKYVIDTNNPLTLFVGQSNRALAEILSNNGVNSAAILTAFNPYSEICTTEENLKNQLALLKDVKDFGLTSIAGYGQDVEERWDREDSTLVLGITESQAEVLADKYGQNGFIWIGSIDGFPTLRLRHPIAIPSPSELQEWINAIPETLKEAARKLTDIDKAWLISVSDSEQLHWLKQDTWDLNNPWPLSKPDGSAMGIGTELDRIFKIIASGQSQIVRA